MKKIDDIFKDGLGESGLPYSESEWIAAEKLIAAKSGAASFWTLKKIGLLVAFIAVISSSLWFILYKEDENKLQESAIANNTNPALLPLDTTTINSKKISSNTEQITQNRSAASAAEPETRISDAPNGLVTSVRQNPAINAVTNNPEENDYVADNEVDVPEGTSVNTEVNAEAEQSLKEPSEQKPKRIFAFKEANLKLKWPASFAFSQWLNQSLAIDGQNLTIDQAQSLASVSKTYQLYLEAFSSHYSTSRKEGNTASRNGESETLLNTSEYGGKIGVQWKNISVSTGLSKLSFQELTNYSRDIPVYGYDTSLVLVKRNYENNPRGKPVALIEERIDSTVVGSRSVIDCSDCKVRIDYLSIPLDVQFEKSKGRGGIFGKLGTSLNIPSATTGSYLLPNPNGEDLQELNSDLLNKYWTVQIGVGLRYGLSSHLDVWTNVEASRAFGSRFSAMDMRYSLLGLRAGLRYKFININRY